MYLIKNYTTLKESILFIKGLKKKYKTNFYVNEKIVSLWIQKKILYINTINEVVFFIKKNQKFYNLFYIASSNNDLEESLKRLLNEYSKLVFICDIVSKDKNPNEKTIMNNVGFFEYTSFIRMYRMYQYNRNNYVSNSNTIVAGVDLLEQIYQLLNTNFDPLCEQLPLKETLLDWIANENVVAYMDNKKVIGFMIFIITGSTLSFRFWYVHSNYRKQKIGSKLFNLALLKSINTKRQIGFFLKSNENSIKRFKHYGFKEDNTYDFVMINKQL